MAFRGLGSKVGALGLVKQPGPPVAVDFGTASLKVLQIAPGETPLLVAAACLPTPEGLLDDPRKRLEFQTDQLPGLIRSAGIRAKRAVCAIPSSHTFCKHAQFARSDDAPLSSMVELMLAEQLGRDPSRLVYRCYEVPGAERVAGGKCEVICLATGREVVNRLMHALKSAKLEPVGMHAEFTALLRAFDYVTRRAEDKSRATLYLDVGCGGTRAVIAHGRELVFTRVINAGGLLLDRSVAEQMGCPLERARAARLSMNDLVSPAARPRPEPAAVGASSLGGGVAVEDDRRERAIAPGLTPSLDEQPDAPASPRGVSLSEQVEILTDEVGLCLRYHESLFGRRIDNAVFVGGEARHRGLCQHVARALRVPAQVADPLARLARTGEERVLGVDLSQPQPGWAVALGLCLSPTDL
ncbi:MAG TPA: pilus assembly protein PilM [Phycisphaerales bacterium]|nr:pilus assembly protein PilM [Phycisphaerales bacterium]